jgi:uncharacterized membrane protein HdeD (DUF308 family)
MRKKFNKLMTISLITSVALIILGLILILFTKFSSEMIGYVFAILLIVNGVLNITDDYKQFKVFYFFDGFTSGLLSIIFGIIIIANIRESYITLLTPIMTGLWIIINSTFKLRMALALKDSSKTNWILPYILSVLTIITGLCLIFNFDMGFGYSRLIGFLVIIYGVCDVIDVFIFKKNIKAIAKVFE